MKRIKLQLKQVSATACFGGLGCPALFKSNRKTYVVVGSRLSVKEARAVLAGKVAKHETVVEIPLDILKKI